MNFVLNKVIHTILVLLFLIITSCSGFESGVFDHSSNLSSENIDQDIQRGKLEIITVQGYEQNSQHVEYVKSGEFAVIEGDIIIASMEEVLSGNPIVIELASDEDGTLTPEDQSPISTMFSYAVNNKGKLWPKGIVPYEFSKDMEITRDSVEKAMKEVTDKTGIQFIKRTNEKDHIYIVETSDSIACFSALGRQGGRQLIQLPKDPDGCYHAGNVHELLHAIGILHEHSRKDRDNYIEVFPENAIDKYKYAFDIAIASAYGPYDYNSIMHYGKYAFAKAFDQTIKPKNGKFIVNSGHLSDLDIHGVSRLYANEIAKRNLDSNTNTTTTPVKNQLAKGYFDGISSSGLVFGWAYDPDDSSKSVAIKYNINNIQQTTFTADKVRNDVNKALNINGNHGFDFQIPNQFQTGRTYQIEVFVQDLSLPVKWISLGKKEFNIKSETNNSTDLKNQLENLPPTGKVELIDSYGFLKGWAFDQDNTGFTSSIQVVIDNKIIDSPIANQYREDINSQLKLTGNHGFAYKIPNTYNDGKTHSINVYALDSQNIISPILIGANLFQLSTPNVFQTPQGRVYRKLSPGNYCIIGSPDAYETIYGSKLNASSIQILNGLIPGLNSLEKLCVVPGLQLTEFSLTRMKILNANHSVEGRITSATIKSDTGWKDIDTSGGWTFSRNSNTGLGEYTYNGNLWPYCSPGTVFVFHYRSSVQPEITRAFTCPK